MSLVGCGASSSAAPTNCLCNGSHKKNITTYSDDIGRNMNKNKRDIINCSLVATTELFI